MTITRMQPRRLLAFLIIALALVAALPLSAQADDNASVRFLHALPGAGPVDVYIDGDLTLTNLQLGLPSLFVQIPAGPHTVTVTQTGVTTALWTQEITPAAGASLTMIVSSTDPLGFTAFQNDVTPLPEGKARITGIHAIAGGPTVDVVLADGRPVIPGLQYNTPYGTLDVPTGIYELAVVPQGGTVDGALIPVTPIALNSGASYQIVAFGTASLPNVAVLSVPAEADANSATLRVVHGVVDGPAVDLYVNDTLVAPNLEFGASTGFMALPAGDYEAVLVPAGDPAGEPVASGTLSLQAGASLTVTAALDAAGVALNVVDVTATAPTAESAVIDLVNRSSADVTATLEDDSATLDVPAGTEASMSLPATSLPLSISVDGVELTRVTGPIYGGALYTIVVVDGGDGPVAILLPAVGVATTIGSAPGNQTLEAVTAQPTEAPVVPTDAPAPTDAAVAPQPTEAPSIVIAPTAAPANALPTGRVLTDPGVNVHLRQFPGSQALSLALLGSGTVVDVAGREGAPAPAPDATATPEGMVEEEPFIDPATLLESPSDDLDPLETWLFISAVAPDGGSISGWINALFLAVTAPNGQPQRLANLPMVPRNTAGEYNSSFVPTALPTLPFEDQVVATVDQLNPGSNLHLRRNPAASSESLGLIPSGTQLVVEGVNDTGEWYRTTFNGTTGWISANYVSLTFNGRAYDPANLGVLATPTPTETPEPTPST
jgi:hypothetical protein